MLNVIDSKTISKIKIEIDDYVPLSFRCLDVEFKPLLYWRTGNFQNSLLEIGISPDDGTLVRIKMPLAGKVYQISNYKEIEEINKLPCIQGIPIVDISNFKLSHIEDEKREIKVCHGEHSLIIHLKKEAFPTKIFSIENVKFGIDSLENLVLVAFFDISRSDILKIKATATL